MNIEKLEIHNYGKLKDRQIQLEPGINVIYGENESGKSTIHNFIRSMLFGVERLRGKGAKTDTYNRFQPWENPTYYAGSMDFSCDSQKFHLERNFYKEMDKARLVNRLDGELLSVEDGDLQMLLGGVNEGIFDNTVSVGQMKSVTKKELAEELQNYIANYQGGADEEINPTEAISILKEKKKSLLLEKKQQQEQLNQSLIEIQTKIEVLKSEQSNCSEKIQESKSNIKILQDAYLKSKEQLQSLKSEEIKRSYNSKKTAKNPSQDQPKNEFSGETVKKNESGNPSDRPGAKLMKLWNMIVIGWAAVLLITLLLAVVFKGSNLSTVFVVMACAAAIQIPISLLIRWWVGAKLMRISQSQQQESIENTNEEPLEENSENTNEEPLEENSENTNGESSEELEKSQWEVVRKQVDRNKNLFQREEGRLHQLQEELQERSVLVENLTQEQLELEDTRYVATSVEEEIEAVELAETILSQTIQNMQNSVGSRLRNRMGEILSELTDGKYRSMALDESMGIKLVTITRSIELYQLSRGTLEQVYFALRMAAGEILCAQEPMPVILDDVFAMYDEERLKRALKWLTIHRKQVILLTCHKRESELLKKLGIDYHLAVM